MQRILRLRSSLFLRLLMYLSFGMFLITLITGTLIYRYFNETLKKQAIESNVGVLRQTKQIVEFAMLEVQQMAFSLSLNKDVQNMVWLPWDMSQDPQIYRKVNDLFSDKVNSSNFIHSIYLYSEKAGKVITNNGMIDLSDFWDNKAIFNFSKRVESSLWLDTQKIVFSDGKTDDVIRFMSTVPITGSQKNGILIINIKENLLYNAVVNINSQSLGNVSILSQKGDVLSSKDKKMLYSRFDGDIIDEMQGQEGFFVRQLGGRDVLVSYIVSGYNGWKYVTLQPVSEVFNNSFIVIKVTGIISGISLIIGLLMAALVSGKYYRPIRSLARTIANRTHQVYGYGGEAASGVAYRDELSYIQVSFDHLLVQNEEFREKFRENEQILKGHFLLSLILGKKTDPDEIRRQMEYYGLEMKEPHYLICILRSVPIEAAETMTEQQKNMLSYQIRTCCEETLRGLCRAAVVDQEQRHLAVLLNLPAADGLHAILRKAKEIAAALREELRAQLNLIATVGIGGVYGRCEDIHLSYQEALEALIYERIAGEGSILSVVGSSTEQGSRKEFITLRNQNAQLMAEIKTGNLDNVKDIMDAIVDEIQKSKVFGYEYKNVMLYQLIHSIVSVILDMNGDIDEVFGSGYNPYHEFGKLRTFSQMKQWLTEALHKTVQFIQDKRQHKNAELLNQVAAFIERHCAEPLSLQMVADHIYMNSTYLSKIFKEATGRTFSDNLGEVRLKKACRLLAETDKMIAQIAEEAGFGNKLNLIRTFKKHLAMTPSDYRKKSVMQRLE